MDRKILLTCLLAGTVGGCYAGDEIADRRPGEMGRGRSDDHRPVVLFVGTSLTAGYGLEVDQAYPALIQEKIDSAGYGFRVVNAGESGATSAGGVRRIGWLLRQPVAVLVLELGANDGLRGHNPTATKSNLGQVIDSTRAANASVEVLVAAMEAPPNLGTEYTSAFRQVFLDIARERGATLIPFLLEGVAGIPELNQPDGIHPTAEGQRLVAANVWKVLGPLLEQLSLGAPAAGASW
jgi:acyl-CoA thioesterase-1